MTKLKSKNRTLLGDSYVLGKNQRRIKTQEIQEQKRVAKEIYKKIENKEEISQEEMIIYLSSLNGYNKSDLRRSIQFDATSTIENLNRLEISFPDSRLLIEEIKTDYHTYLAIEHAIKEEIKSIRDLITTSEVLTFQILTKD